MQSLQQSDVSSPLAPAPAFYSLRAIVSFFLLPLLWALIIPALVFSRESKELYNSGNIELSYKYSAKTKRFLVAAWAIFLIVAAAIISVHIVLHLSLI